MFGTVRSLGRVPRLSRYSSPRHGTRTLSTRDLTRFDEGDRFLIDGSKLSTALVKGGLTESTHGKISHDEIIGQEVSAPFYVRTQKGKLYKIEQPSLDQYVSLTPRLVTPVYAPYATTIVSLLDIHPTPFSGRDDSSDKESPRPLELLEAGTGHGALTLHIAQAIASANPPLLPSKAPPRRAKGLPGKGLDESEKDKRDQLIDAWHTWKQGRRAVLHTVENVVTNRWHAEKVVREFRQGVYWPHVDFHHDDLGDWIGEKLKEKEGSPFLDYVFLDMPGVHNKLKDVHPAMRTGARVVVFVPSITQIGECVKLIQDEHMPLSMEKVIELGEGISNGRRWDVRAVKPRKSPTAERHVPSAREAASLPVGNDGSQEDEDINTTAPGDEIDDAQSASSCTPTVESEGETTNASERNNETVMICRPQIGERTQGGGFIAFFRKNSPESMVLERQWKKTQTGPRRRLYR